MNMAVSFITYATYSRRETGDIITFEKLEEGSLLSETSDDMEIGDKSDEYSIMPPLISKE